MTSTTRESDEPVQGARTFQTSGAAYDSFMGRYSRPLSVAFATTAGVRRGVSALDVGCGPGALTSVLVDRLGVGAVAALDPSAPFVAECGARHPGLDVRQGRAEAIPFPNDSFDVVLAQLVLHFVSDAPLAAEEFHRVLRPNGVVAACVWDFSQGMQVLRHFWAAALTLDPHAPEEAQALRFGRQGEITALLDSARFRELSETTMTVTSTYADFDELWSGFLAGIGPAGAYCLAQPERQRDRLRSVMFEIVGSPTGSFSLNAVARCAVGRVPD